MLWLEYWTQEDPSLPKGAVLATLQVELRTELKRTPQDQLHMIRHPFGMRAWTFVSPSPEDAHERAMKEIEKLMHQFGELWRESRKGIGAPRDGQAGTFAPASKHSA